MSGHPSAASCLGALFALPLLAACAATPAALEVSGPSVATPSVSFHALLDGGDRRDVTSAATLPCGTRAIEAVVQIESSAPGSEPFGRTRATAAELDVQVAGGLRVQSADDGRLLLDVDPLAGAFVGHQLEIVHHAAPAKLAASWKQDISCHREVGVTGRSGQGPGAGGEDGPRLSAYVTKARSSSLGPVTFVILEGTGKPLYWVAPLGSPVAIYAHGGNGGPGGDGGRGGTVEVEYDERFPELNRLVTWQARGGRGGGGRDGSHGEGSLRAGDVLLTLIARSDLPAGFSVLDAPIAARNGKLRPHPIRRPRPPQPPPRDPSKVHPPVISRPRKPPDPSLLFDPFDARR